MNNVKTWFLAALVLCPIAAQAKLNIVVTLPDCAALVRGTDRYGHFEPTPQPLHDFDEAAVAFHKRATDNLREILFKDAKRVRATL